MILLMSQRIFYIILYFMETKAVVEKLFMSNHGHVQAVSP